MRRALYSLLLLTVPMAVFAHHDEDELGHHWASQAYAGELRFQFIVMLGILGVLIISEVARRLRGVKR